ncbi:MAG: DUF4446 family protein [Lachnospiraceae bacterium]|nr:DUF4446 family protein [Clostridium sp.]MDD6180299.1 DUF4446 family protein [Clostridium sp.]MDY4821835.1 DUF4446 family protein [Lachnospiraceae bacterium]
MNSNILQSIGLGNLDIAYLFLILLIFIVVLFIIIILQMKKLNRLQKRISKFMTGKDAKSLEKDIVGLYEDNKFLKINVDKNKKDIRTLYKNMEHAFQKIGLIKYDAFQQMGGKLSFSLALLDENNNGFILNSVHSTEGCYTYTKEIKSGECAISLGEEEQQALDMAIGE